MKTQEEMELAKQYYLDNMSFDDQWQIKRVLGQTADEFDVYDIPTYLRQKINRESLEDL